MPLDPHLPGLLDFIDSAGLPPMSEGTPEAARAGFRALTVDSRPADAAARGRVGRGHHRPGRRR